MRIPYEIWDVFTSRPLLGNPLAVFPDAAQIPEAQLSAIAREMAHSETTFVYPRAPELEQREGVKTRIFSKAGAEMQFAGHPVLGTAFALWSVDRRRTALSLPIGKVPVRFEQGLNERWEGEMTQPEPKFAETHRAADLAPLLGVSVDDVDSALPLQTVSTGRPNVLVMLKTREAVRRAEFHWDKLDVYFSTGDLERGVYLLTRDVEVSTAQFHARKVTRTVDDPVTGSAAGCAIAWLVAHGAVPAGKRVSIEQGSEVKRRGQLFAIADLAAGKVSNVRVGGQAVRSASGNLEI